MFWNKRKQDKRNTLVFKIESGIKRSRPQNVSDEQKDLNCLENSESGRSNNEGENVNG